MTMASLHKDPRGKSPFYYCAYSRADGVRAFRSTGKTKKDEAWIICQSFVEMEGKVAEGSPSADQLMKVVNATLQRLGQDPVQRPSAKIWFARWLATEKGAVADSTLERYRQVTQSFLDCLGSKQNVRLSAITTEDVTKFRDKLLAEGRSPQTVNLTVRKILKRPFKVALDEGIIDRNPIAAVRHLRGSTAEKGTFSAEQVTKLVAAATGDWKGLILTAFYTGGRLKDLATLKQENVDLVEKTLTFTQNKTEGKSSKATVKIPLHPELEEYLLSRSSSDSLKAPLFPELYNKPGAGKSGMSMAFKRIMTRARIDGGLIRERLGAAGRNLSALSFHSLRHSFNSALANSGVSQELRQKLTGHASEAMNALYTHHELETLRNAVQSLPRLPKNESKT
jgi:integrase